MPGGWAAYTDATFFLGSYRAHLLAKRKTGEPCSLDIKVTVANTTDWVSASKTLKGLGWLIPDYPAHPRHEGPYHPSKGGTMEQRYIFKLESVPISKKCYLTD
ncbi:MAG: hypothetical protein NTX52_10740 [Planctomycetota bacterium]|nr:hypothetical protein [Planctomycetota bacterium]